jgi:hypothetical protein
MGYIKSLEWMSKLVIQNWGIVQHSELTTPSQKEPSSVDDNARAAVLFSEFSDVYQDPSSLETTSNFVIEAFESRTDGYPNNYKNKNGHFQGRDGVPDQECDLKDCYGRALYALVKLKANDLFLKYATKTPEELEHTNALSLSGIANAEYLKTKEDRRTLNILKGINEELKRRYIESSSKNWIGPDERYTYDAYRSAEALATIGKLLDDPAAMEIGWKGITFLNQNLIQDGIYHPIGNEGWFQKGKSPARYSQQAIEAAGFVEAHVAAYNLIPNPHLLNFARKGREWFHGKNSDGIQIVLPTGEVQDGIHAKGEVNKNCGAESVIAYLTTIKKFRKN